MANQMRRGTLGLLVGTTVALLQMCKIHVPIARDPTPPPEFETRCSKTCSLSARYAPPMRELVCPTITEPLSLRDTRTIELVNTSTDADADARYAQCLASFNGASDELFLGRTLSRAEQTMLGLNPTVRARVDIDYGCGKGAISVTCMEDGRLVSDEPIPVDGGDGGTEVICGEGTHLCGAICYPNDDPAHCGTGAACTECPSGNICIGGVCRPNCGALGQPCDPTGISCCIADPDSGTALSCGATGVCEAIAPPSAGCTVNPCDVCAAGQYCCGRGAPYACTLGRCLPLPTETCTP